MLMNTTTTPNTRFRLIKTETLPIDKELANHFDQMDASLTERKLNEKRLRFLKEKVENGLLVTFHWATVQVVELGNKQFRMNGQHSSRMLATLPEPFPAGLIAHVDHYEVNAKDDIPVLFRQFDPVNSARRSPDVAYVYQRQYDELRELDSEISKKACSGVTWYRKNIERVTNIPTGDDIYALFSEDEELRSYVIWTCSVLDKDRTKEMNKQTVIAAMYGTFLANQNKAREFWALVSRMGVTYEPQHPTSVLYEWLKQLLKDRDYVHANSIKTENCYNGCVFAWNAYLENKNITYIRWDTSRGFYHIAE